VIKKANMEDEKQQYYAFGSCKLPKGYKKITEYIITREMTAKEKANELMQKFENLEPLADTELDERFQKTAALIAINEIIIALDANGSKLDKEYWGKVKEEIKQYEDNAL
jgi:siderophore synthetase component